MTDLVTRTVTAMREMGYPLDDVGNGWFCTPGRFLHLTEGDLRAYLAGSSGGG